MRFDRAVPILVLCAAPVVADDLTIVSKATVNNGAPTTTTTYVTSAKLRTGEGNGDMLYEFATGRLAFIDNKKKEYWETTTEETKAAMAALNAQMQAMEQQMANLPPAIREKMAGMAGGGTLPPVKVEKAGGIKTIAGYSCEGYLLTMGESMRMETCNTKEIVWPVQAWDARNALAGLAPSGKGFAKLVEELKKMQGYALSETTTMKLMGKNSATTREVTEVRKGPVADSVFAVPAGYKKVESPFSKLAQKK